MGDDKVKVMFVCLGNICRSPMAEAVLRHRVEQKGLTDKIVVDSCGTGDWHVGKPPHIGTQQILQRKGISFDGITAAALDPERILEFDYIIAMDRSNIENMSRAGVPRHRINLLSDFIAGKEGVEVPDPYYTGNFDEVYELVEQGVEGILNQIIKDQGWIP